MASRTDALRKLAWFVALWAAGVLSVMALGFAIRLALT